MRPVLGIICCNRAVGPETAQAVMSRYAEAAMRHADCAALLVPALPALMRAEEVMGRLDGLLLTGSPSNVGAAHYGEADGDGPFDPARDRMAFDLVRAAAARGIPVFGICRGFQELNVALGGTLRRDASASGAPLRHHAPDDAPFDAMFAHRHSVRLAPGGRLARAFGAAEAVVNSVHYQAVGRLAPGVVVEATAPDGLVEAFSGRHGASSVLAVQWHPEWRTGEDGHSQAFFRLLGEDVRRGGGTA